MVEDLLKITSIGIVGIVIIVGLAYTWRRFLARTRQIEIQQRERQIAQAEVIQSAWQESGRRLALEPRISGEMGGSNLPDPDGYIDTGFVDTGFGLSNEAEALADDPYNLFGENDLFADDDPTDIINLSDESDEQQDLKDLDALDGLDNEDSYGLDGNHDTDEDHDTEHDNDDDLTDEDYRNPFGRN